LFLLSAALPAGAGVYGLYEEQDDEKGPDDTGCKPGNIPAVERTAGGPVLADRLHDEDGRDREIEAAEDEMPDFEFDCIRHVQKNPPAAARLAALCSAAAGNFLPPNGVRLSRKAGRL
jgi:hypothetical protein